MARLQSQSLHQASWNSFLLVRRGLPLSLTASGLLAALIWPHWAGWCLLASVIALTLVGPTLLQGEAWLRNRQSLARQDAFFFRILRPLFRALQLEESWIKGFCDWNNHRVGAYFSTRKAQRPMVLLPHCAQWIRCRVDLSHGLSACKSCGRCPMGELVDRSKQIPFRVSNRSAKAYREAQEYHPDLIFALCCPDRLVKGLLLLPDIPAYVLPLALPYGMCVDTSFDATQLQAVLAALTESHPQPIPMQRKDAA